MTIDTSLQPTYPYTSAGSYYGVVQSGNVGMGPGNPGGQNTIGVPTTVYEDTVATGIHTAEQQILFKIVPNPTAAYVHVYMDNNSINNVTGKLYNEAGQLLQDIGYMQPTSAYTLDLTKYAAGVYFLRMTDGKSETVKKIVKSN
jgi:hypothetical protein